MEDSWGAVKAVGHGDETKASILKETGIIFQVGVLRAYHSPWHLVGIPKAF